MHLQTPLRIGLIGVGGYGSAHRKAIERCRQKGLAQLTVVADPTLQHRDDLRNELEQAGIPWFADYREMIADRDQFDAIAIAAPIPFHYSMARACIEAGIPVYLEKPPVPLLDQLEELIAADSRKQITVGFQYISSLWIGQLKDWIVSGRLGDIQEIRVGACWPRTDVYYNRAGWAGKFKIGQEPIFDGPATNALSHMIHNIMYLASPVPGAYDVPVDVQAELYRARPIESYDGVCLRGTLSTGTRYHVVFSHASREALPIRMEVRGTKGWARYVEGSHVCESSFGPVTHVEVPGASMAASYENFVSYVTGAIAAPRTLLQDTRGYLLATNGMLLSSGCVHSISADYVRQEALENSSVYHVEGQPGDVNASIETGRLFSEMDLPWAVSTPSVSLVDYGPAQYAEMRRLLGLAPAPVASV